MAKELHPRDDLFEGTKMSFGEHLEELRGALFRALLGILLGVLVGLYFARDVVIWIQSPLENALYLFQREQAQKLLAKEFKGEIPLEWTNTLVSRRLIPELAYVEPGELSPVAEPQALAQALQASAGEAAFAERDLKAGREQALCREWLAAAENFQEPRALSWWSRWSGEPQSAAVARSQALWELLPAEHRATIAQIAERDSLADGDRAALVEALNALVALPELSALPPFSDEAWFHSLSGGQALARLQEGVKEAPAGGPQVRNLNRLLLAFHFRAAIDPPVLDLKPVVLWKESKFVTQSLSPHEPFLIWMKAALLVGVVLSSPYTFLQVWNFVASGLYPHEKRYVHLYLPFSLGLFLAGASLAFFAVFPPVLRFLFEFNAKMNIAPETRINEWLGFVLILPLGFGVSFQLPLVMLFLHRIGIFSVKSYLSSWRISILIIFIVSMVLTPADPISMLLMAGPLSVLYFGGIALCHWLPRGRNPFSEAYEPS